MDSKKEALSVRNMRLFQSVISNNCPMQKRSANMNISHDALIDSFLVIFDECSKDGMKKDIFMSYFINKYKSLVTEIRSLRVSPGDFELKSVIGNGYFGEVRVAKEKVTGDIFAIKIINKAKTLKNASAALFEEERDILSSATSPWLTSLQYAFQDAQSLYLVMEYLPGGDLLSLLEREGGRLSVDQARFYLAEILLAIHDLHRLGYAHRDVKPENVLLDRLGHVKLADFGSAARLSQEGRVLTAMPAGTPDYIAPEVLQALEAEKSKKSSYGIDCDFWSLGVLGYALVFGSTPFSGPRTSVTYSKILTHQMPIQYPESVSASDSFKDLINSLLSPAATRVDYHGVRKHLFFLEVDFSTLRQSVPPIVPVVKSPEDTSNFTRHDRKTAEPILTPRESQKEFSGKQLPFIGFTFSGVLNRAEETVTGVSGKQPPDLRLQQDSLQVVRRENQNLLSKLLEVQKANKGSDGLLELVERERGALQKDLTKERQINATLRKCIEEERHDRRQTEEKALMIARQGKHAQEREMKACLSEWQAKVDELTDRLTLAHTLNNELTSKCDRAESEVQSLRVELENFESLEKSYKDKLTKAREFKRRSVTEFESRLNRIQNQEEKWQGKLNAEITSKQNLLLELQELNTKSSKAESKWQDEKEKLEKDLGDTRRQLQTAEVQMAAAHLQLADTARVDAMQGRLREEQEENSKLRAKIIGLETELSNTTHSFLQHETNGQREQLQDLEKELRDVSEEKRQLQAVLEGMQERDKENKCKLTELERILEALEREVGKLEKENADLKKAAPIDLETPKMSAEAEIQYQQRVLVLEQQIEKLEAQIGRLRESAILEKQELRTAQSKLWKTEKELSDAKIDIRIAKREAKAAEDQVGKLQEELKGVREMLKKIQEERESLTREELKKVESLRAQLRVKEDEVEVLKKFQVESENLLDSQKRLQGDYNSLRQQILESERQLSAAKAQVEALQLTSQTLSNEKTALTATVDELRTRVSNLELNNTVLKETGKMLDEQLEDYEKFVDDQTSTIHNLKQENGVLAQSLVRLESDLGNVRATLSEEKALRNKAENAASNLQTELTFKAEVVDELRAQLDFASGNSDTLSSRLMEKEKLMRELELDLSERDQDVRELQAEVLWLKEEISAKLSDVYLLKEDNCRLNQELEEASCFADSLQDRIRDLERVIAELETFHRQREMKDDATKQQQNKLISFLQAKLQEDKKKKTLADKLFGGGRRREPPSPQMPQRSSPCHSPRVPVAKSTSDQWRKKPLNSPRKATDSPRTQQALTQLVNSPTNRMARQMSLPRMHHNIPHRFKIQSVTQTGKCVSCNSIVTRSSKASVCGDCASVAHPKCAVTAPKTCGLPAELARHFAQQVQKTEKSMESLKSEVTSNTEGWVDLMMPGENSWQRRYLKVDGGRVLIFNTSPTRAESPVHCWDLAKGGGQTLVSDEVATHDLPGVAKQDLPFIIKVVNIPRTTCWPGETYYLLIRNSADKTKWTAALQSLVTSGTPLDKTHKKSTPVFSDKNDLGVNCIQEINDGARLLGTECGLFALQGSFPHATPVQLHGVTAVHAISLAPHINQILMVAGEGRRLISADYRLMVSNASAAACVNPGVATEIVPLDNEDPVLLISVSKEMDGAVYLTAVTEKNVQFLCWNVLLTRFERIRSMPTSQPVKCVHYHLNSTVIVGTETFQSVSLKDFSVQEMLRRPEMSNSFVLLGSFAMEAVSVGPKEVLLCFREFGLFVDERGQKTRPDLKWAQVPKRFAFCKPFLYVVSSSSVEILRLLPAPEATSSADDTMSIATTATISDTLSVELDNPRLLGVSSKGGIFVSVGRDVLLVEASRLLAEAMGSCATLNRVLSEGQFSFTSSIVGSLDGEESDGYKTSPENKIKHTEL